MNAEAAGENDAATAGAETPAAPQEEEEQEPEDNSKTLDQYLAEKAEQSLGGVLGKKEARTVSADDIEGKVFAREQDEDASFFAGKAKPEAKKSAKPKKEKVYIEVDGQFANPAGRPPRQDRERSDRPQRGRGAPRGAARGAGRGAARGGAGRGPRQSAVDANDEKAFPALGA